MPLIDLQDLVRAGETGRVRSWLAEAGTLEIVEELTRLNPVDTALVFRLLPRDRALAVFEALDPVDQQQVLDGLRDDRVRALVEEMDPDDRARLFDELPATVAARLLAELSPESAPAQRCSSVGVGRVERSSGASHRAKPERRPADE